MQSVVRQLSNRQCDFIASFCGSADTVVEEVEGSQGMQKQSAGSSLADKDAAVVTVVDAVAGSQHGAEDSLPRGMPFVGGAVDAFVPCLGTLAADASRRNGRGVGFG